MDPGAPGPGARLLTDPAHTPAFAPVVVGGPARNGKTMLTAMIGAADTPYFGAPFELLLNVYGGAAGARTRAARARALREYCTARRATSPDRSRTAAPADFIGSESLEGIVEAAADAPGAAAGAVRILDAIAAGQGRASWIGADYHAECDYRRLRAVRPGLRLIVALRDPVEAVADSLYWRTFPERTGAAGNELRFRTSLWNLAAAAGLALARRFPGDVLLLGMNRLWAGDEPSVARLAAFVGCEAGAISPERRTWFSRGPGGTFLCPDGSARPLLDEAEVRLIESRTRHLRAALGGAAPVPATAALAVRMPVVARDLITLRYRPRRRFARSVARLRRAVRLFLGPDATA